MPRCNGAVSAKLKIRQRLIILLLIIEGAADADIGKLIVGVFRNDLFPRFDGGLIITRRNKA